MSVDGRIAPPAGGAGFGSRRDRRRLHEARAAADAVLLGAATVAADDPPGSVLADDLRDARRGEGRSAEPLFVIVSGRASCPPAARLLAPRGEERRPIVCVAADAPADRVAALSERAEVRRSGGSGSVALDRVLEELAERDGIRRLLCEGGGVVNAAMLAAGLVDELLVTVAPVLLGAGGSASPVDGALPRTSLTLLEGEVVEGEVFARYRVGGV